MRSEEPQPPRVEVSPAAADEEPILANLLELYAHDFSEFLDLPLQANGRFGYPSLSLYWKEKGRFPFLVRVDGQLAGFVLVSRGSRIREAPSVWDMAEFFIVRRYRKQGIGAAVATEIFRRFPGAWEVRVLESNRPALPFWESVARAFAADGVGETFVEQQEKRWHVFRFTSSDQTGAR
jgi:predicted acetyltransferase